MSASYKLHMYYEHVRRAAAGWERVCVNEPQWCEHEHCAAAGVGREYGNTGAALLRTLNVRTGNHTCVNTGAALRRAPNVSARRRET